MRMKSRQRGFTLIELLVVITIIVVAASIIMVAGRGGEGTALRASQRILSGIANGARGQALLKNAETRLIIYGANPGGSNFDYDKYRRFSESSIVTRAIARSGLLRLRGPIYPRASILTRPKVPQKPVLRLITQELHRRLKVLAMSITITPSTVMGPLGVIFKMGR